MIKKILNLGGSIVAIVTPFTDDDQVDYDAYQNLLNLHLENGTNGIVVCGTTGETPTLSKTEYADLIRFTVSYIDGRIPVIAGTGSNSTQQTIENSLLAESLQVDALLISTPYYNKPTQKGLLLHFEAIANHTNLPILLYNVPGRTGVNMSPEITLELAKKHKSIIGIKEASGNMPQIQNILVNKPASFLVFSGDDALALPIIKQGGAGGISAIANEIPAEFSRMIHFGLSGEFEQAELIHNRFIKLMELNFLESNPIPVKTALYMQGLIKNKFRLPMCEMADPVPLKLELEHLGLI